MSYQVAGKIKVVKDVKQVSDTFKVREFVITVEDGKYPQSIQLQATNEKCDVLNTFAVGSDVTVAFNLRGREWTNPQGEIKYFNSLDAWKIEASTGAPIEGVPNNQAPIEMNTDGQGDDLPF